MVYDLKNIDLIKCSELNLLFINIITKWMIFSQSLKGSRRVFLR